MTVSPRAYRLGEFTVDAADRVLLREAREVPLRPKAFDTLLCLVSHRGHLVTKDALLAEVWPGTHVSDAVLTHCIAEVRQALHDDPRAPRYVRTVARRGYKVTAPIEPIGAGALAAAEVTAGAPSADDGALPPPLPAIAVLPFANLSADPENEFLCDGISEELINALTRLPSARVVAHTSSFAFKGRQIDVRDIGRQLDVGTVLEGSVRRSGERLRISAQLVDARSGFHLWAEQYDRTAGDLFEVQDEIARAIVRELRVELAQGVKAPLVRSSTSNGAAHEFYLRGRYYWHRRYSGFMQRAIECFERAVALDPRFALAYSGLADCFGSLGVWAFVPPHSVFPRAQELADRALALDDQLGEAHASRAFVRLFYEWDWDGAERGLRHALALNPGAALTRLWLGHQLSIVGRMAEAVDEVTRAYDLDPLSPVVAPNVGWTHLLAGDVPRAFDVLEKATAVDPRNAMACIYLALAHAVSGRFREAAALHHRALEIAPAFPGLRVVLGCSYAACGERDRALEILRETAHHRRDAYVSAFYVAQLHATLGQFDAAFSELERALEERDALLVWVKFFPAPACVALRADPRFGPVLDRLALR